MAVAIMVVARLRSPKRIVPALHLQRSPPHPVRLTIERLCKIECGAIRFATD